jgi:hypothetical protein
VHPADEDGLRPSEVGTFAHDVLVDEADLPVFGRLATIVRIPCGGMNALTPSSGYESSKVPNGGS